MPKLRPARDGDLWYPSEENECIEKYKAGWPIDDIAKHHGRYPNAIRIRLEKMGVSCFHGTLKEYLTKDPITEFYEDRNPSKRASPTAVKRRLLLL